MGSFGDFFRIDYGTGHEAAFVAWMFCMTKLGVFGEDDRLLLVLHIFAKYIIMLLVGFAL